jgi:flagellar biosynthesis protein FlhB
MDPNNPYAAAAFAMVPLIIASLVFAVIIVVALWKIFVKAGEPGWAAIVPIYDIVVQFRVAGLNPWLVLLLLIPLVNVAVAIILALRLGEAFGKGGAWSFFLLFVFAPIGYLILGFGGDPYRGPVRRG